LNGNETSDELIELLYSDKARKILQSDESNLDSAKAAIKTLDALAVVMESLDHDAFTSSVFRSPVGRAKDQYTQLGVWPWIDRDQ
jgi:hypothetical protein